MYDICTIGHITNDKVVTHNSVKYMPGGTAFYFSKALQYFDLNNILVTAVGTTEQSAVKLLQSEGLLITALSSRHTVFFENIYPKNQDYREQNVLETADPFSIATMPGIAAKIYHLGPLLAHDIPVDLLKMLASRGLVSLDVQGYLRNVKNKKVIFSDWIEKKQALPYVTFLKANDFEMELLTGTKDVEESAIQLAAYGIKEVIITLGSKGSIIYANETFHKIPAFTPASVVDATGCGDTYMAGYLYQKSRGASVDVAGTFGAAMATLKIQSSGPFSGTENQVNTLLFSASELTSK
ncbi:MAG: PfkB family carbohydrate kinase [Bacteroidota bacterium]